MKPYIYILIAILLSTNFAFCEAKLDTRKLTFPEALEELKEEIKFTYVLPRTYFNKGAHGASTYSLGSSEDLLNFVVRNYCGIHRLSFEKKGTHYLFRRNPSYAIEPSEPPSLLEALGSQERYAEKENIELRECSLIKAELKFESSPGYTGYYWHLVFGRVNGGTDGGIGANHFFIYSDLLVEHKADEKIIEIKRQSSQEIIDSTKQPHY